MWKLVITRIEKHGSDEYTKFFEGIKTRHKQDIIDFLQTHTFNYSKDYDEIIDVYYKANPIASFYASSGKRALQSVWVQVIQTKEDNYDWLN